METLQKRLLVARAEAPKKIGGLMGDAAARIEDLEDHVARLEDRIATTERELAEANKALANAVERAENMLRVGMHPEDRKTDALWVRRGIHG